MDVKSIRLLSQQLVSPVFETPAEVVDYFGAMQAQEYRQMRWAVAMRTKHPSAEAFRQSYDRGDIVRLHLLRGTWQLVSARNYWWLLALCAAKAATVIKGWMRANHIDIPDREQAAIRDIFGQTAADKGTVTKQDLAEALLQRGIAMDDHRLSYHIRFAELEGFFCSGDLRPMKMTYALAAQKMGHAEPIEHDEALTRLARLYFQSHAPATLDDYFWWSGLNISDCRRGIANLGDELERTTCDGHDFYLHHSCRTRGVRSNNTLLLPAFDEYLIGYKSRHLALNPRHIRLAYTNNGIFHPVVAHNGIICANWKPFDKELQVIPFPECEYPEQVAKNWKEYQLFLTR